MSEQRKAKKMHSERRSTLLLTAAMLAAGVAAVPARSEPFQPVKREPRTAERLTKAEKKRARKAAQRLKLSHGMEKSE
jgi:hypothetical protein